jgi:probable F420-dependent oxidoreductase
MNQLEHPGKLGVWTLIDPFSAPDAARFARQLEEWGYSVLWIPETVGRDPFTFLGWLAGQTGKLTFATGIANVYARDAVTLKAIWKTLSELLPRRFVLGLGVSHPHLVTKLRGHEWLPPVQKMRDTLDGLTNALYKGPEPAADAPVVIAALRPKMLELAREKARGAHPYLVTPEHTRRARQILGKGPWLCTEQMVVLTTDAKRAREVARANLQVYLRAPNYQNNLRELGYADDEMQNGGSDRLVDALVAWGDEAALRKRIEEHWDAGADHVCIQPFRTDGAMGPDVEALRQLAPGA